MTKPCPQCGKIPSRNAVYCDQCGASLQPAAPVDQTPAVQPPVAESGLETPPAPSEYGPPSGQSGRRPPPPLGIMRSESSVPESPPTPDVALPEPGSLLPPPKESVSPAPLPDSDAPELMAPDTLFMSDTFEATLECLNGLRIELSGAGEYFVGRSDPANNWYPEADLAPHGGETGGVSRKHARIVRAEGQTFLEDLGSRNGSYVNKVRVEAGKPHSLRDGDQIGFGRVVVIYHQY